MKLICNIACCLVLLLNGTSCTETKKQDYLVFNISSAFYSPEKDNMTNIIDSISYYKLDNSHIVGEINRFHLYGDTICFVEPNIVSAFGLNTGQSIWTIDNQGRGPQEYSSVYRTLFLPNNIYIDGWNDDFKVYDIAGKYIKTIFVDSLISKQSLIQYIPERLSYKDNMFVGYHFNRTGSELEMIIILDENGNKISSISRTGDLKERESIDIGGFGLFYAYGKELHFWEQSNDTIFKIANNSKLYPHIVLYRDDTHRALCEKFKQPNSNHFFIHNIKETSYYLIANAFRGDEDGVLLCNKRNKETRFYQYSILNKFESAIFRNAISDQYAEELITFLYAYEYIDAKKNGDLPTELSNINITDENNPIILKLKLK